MANTPRIPEVYPITLGGNTFGWTSDESTSFAVLDAFSEAGGNHIDTSDSYSAFAPGNKGGESESVIGSWLHSRRNRDSVMIATKVGQHPNFIGLAPANIAAAADASLRRLGTGHIDLYYAHIDDPAQSIADIATSFDGLVRAGKVRQLGVSNMSPERIIEWLDLAEAEGLARPVALQPHYNLLERGYEQTYRAVAERYGLAVFPYFALAAGLLTGKYRSPDDIRGTDRERQMKRYGDNTVFSVIEALVAVAEEVGSTPTTVALAWLLAQPSITAPIASARVPEQLVDVVAATALRLSPEQVDRLTAASAVAGVKS